MTRKKSKPPISSPQRAASSASAAISPLTLHRAELIVAQSKKDKVDKKKKPALPPTKSKPKPKAPKAQKAGKVVHELSDDESDEEEEDAVDQKDKAAGDTKTAWAKEEYHHLTDTLLTVIEASEEFKTALGFKKEPGEKSKTKGSTLSTVHVKIGTLLRSQDPYEKWNTVSEAAMGKIVKNRMSTLKRDFIKWRNSMGETGQGLVQTAEMEEKIIAGSEIANKWDVVKKKYPWYRRMLLLSGESPVASRESIANSTTDLSEKLGALGRKTRSTAAATLDDSDADAIKTLQGTSIGSDSGSDSDHEKNLRSDDGPNSDSHLGSPRLDDTPVKSKKEVVCPTKPAVTVAPIKLSNKRKTPMDQITEVAAAERATRMKMMETSSREKTQRSKMKEATALEREKLLFKHQQLQQKEKLEHESREKDKDRAMQIELARITAGASRSSRPHSTGYGSSVTRPGIGGPSGAAAPQDMDATNLQDEFSFSSEDLAMLSTSYF